MSNWLIDDWSIVDELLIGGCLADYWLIGYLTGLFIDCVTVWFMIGPFVSDWLVIDACLVYRLFDRLIGKMLAWLTSWLIGERYFIACYVDNTPIDWLTGWLMGWLMYWLIDWLVDWLIDRLIVLFDWLVVRLFGWWWLIDWLISWLLDWLFDDLFDWLIGDRFIDWLID